MSGRCLHCGGEVGEDGQSSVLGEAEEFEPFEGKETDQHEGAERLASGFAEAVGRRGPRGYAEGGEVQNDEWIDMGTHQIKREDMAPEDWEKAQAHAKTSRQDKVLAETTPEIRAQFAEAKKGEEEWMRKRKAERYGAHRPGVRR